MQFPTISAGPVDRVVRCGRAGLKSNRDQKDVQSAARRPAMGEGATEVWVNLRA